jgi:putative ABC transport system permease protein
MLSRILRGSLMRRKRRKLLSLLAVTLGIAAATAVATISLDVGDKVSRELRSFGANISVTPAADGLAVAVGGVDYRPAGAGAYLAESDLVNLRKIFWRNNIMAFAPLLDVPVTLRRRRAILVGSWFSKNLQVAQKDTFRTGLKELHPAWKVEGRWPNDDDPARPVECLVGQRLAAALGATVSEVITVNAPVPEAMRQQGGLKLENRNSKIETRNSKLASTGSSEPRISNSELRISGILEAGGAEDNEILAPLGAVQKFAGLEGKVRRVEVSALTKPEDAFARADVTKLSAKDFDRWYCTPYVSSISYQIQQAIPGSEAKPVYRVAATEGKILDRVELLMEILAAAALATAALAVASMMLATVLERRAEIGIFKSLGSTNARVAALFLLEAGTVGLAGGAAGYFLGSLLARQLSRQVFGTAASFHWVFLPAALALALLVTLAGSALPLRRGLKISPAMVLRD